MWTKAERAEPRAWLTWPEGGFMGQPWDALLVRRLQGLTVVQAVGTQS